MPWACSHRIGAPSDCRHAIAEYGTANGAHPVETTVALTVSPSRVGVERVNEHGGGGGTGPSGVACATPLAAPNARAHVIKTTIGRPIITV